MDPRVESSNLSGHPKVFSGLLSPNQGQAPYQYLGSSIGRVAVSKTEGWGFDALPGCQCFMWGYQSGLMAPSAKPSCAGSNPAPHFNFSRLSSEGRARHYERRGRRFDPCRRVQVFKFMQRDASRAEPHFGLRRKACVAPFPSGCIVSPVRRPALEAGGRRFKSCRPDQF